MILAPILVLLALGQEKAPEPPPVKRPRDPYVFRCVLDQRARMIVIALDDEMWVAYDATNCGLYKAWKGGVHFDGAVYTTVHGPQPTVEGTAYTAGIDGPVWRAYVDDKPVACTTQYKGYVLEKSDVVLEWEVQLADGRKIEVLELPEFMRPKNFFNAETLEQLMLGEGNQPTLHRILSAKEIPPGVKLCLTTRTDAPKGKAATMFEHERIEDVKDASGNVVESRVYSEAPLTAEQRMNGWMLFFNPIENPKSSVPANGETHK